ncbi:unnamed protein product [Zymoseptoria tritici ST99CH_3D1]|uniref:Uncharacterized protein n=1 Tax=Zymoseptoria tritici (strain ST99CH_3D7) TaxID=1276538 RepID=A0A1X7S1Q6_ZYMT9|nr:unnamed protein product [Zymoseptoria tritici ST99CH_3D7]SMR60071.1 unnamed protein product [Zymoseptoria tritici ST99CH_3D1]
MRCPQPNTLYRPYGDLVTFQSGPAETYYFTLACTTGFGSSYGLNDEETGLSVRSYVNTTGLDDPDRGNIGECMSICDAYNRQKDVEDGVCSAGYLQETGVCFIFDQAGRAAVGERPFEGSAAFLRVRGGDVGGRQVCAVEGLQDAFN